MLQLKHKSKDTIAVFFSSLKFIMENSLLIIVLSLVVVLLFPINWLKRSQGLYLQLWLYAHESCLLANYLGIYIIIPFIRILIINFNQDEVISKKNIKHNNGLSFCCTHQSEHTIAVLGSRQESEQDWFQILGILYFSIGCFQIVMLTIASVGSVLCEEHYLLRVLNFSSVRVIDTGFCVFFNLDLCEGISLPK